MSATTVIMTMRKEIRDRLLADTGAGGLRNAGTPLIADDRRIFVENPVEPTQGNIFPYIVIAFDSSTRDDAFTVRQRLVTFEVHVFAEEMTSGTDTLKQHDDIVTRIEGDWDLQAGGTPTFGLEQFTPALSGTGWETGPLLNTSMTQIDDEAGIRHSVGTWEATISNVGV